MLLPYITKRKERAVDEAYYCAFGYKCCLVQTTVIYLCWAFLGEVCLPYLEQLLETLLSQLIDEVNRHGCQIESKYDFQHCCLGLPFVKIEQKKRYFFSQPSTVIDQDDTGGHDEAKYYLI